MKTEGRGWRGEKRPEARKTAGQAEISERKVTGWEKKSYAAKATMKATSVPPHTEQACG